MESDEKQEARCRASARISHAQSDPQRVFHLMLGGKQVIRGAGILPAILRRVDTRKTAGETPAPQHDA
jgi:hypothetical protein